MRTVVFAIVAAGLVVGFASPTVVQAQPRDTGSMDYPSPLPQGNLNTTRPTRQLDTGNMAYPRPLPQGDLSTTTQRGPNRPTDTGSMEVPKE